MPKNAEHPKCGNLSNEAAPLALNYLQMILVVCICNIEQEWFSLSRSLVCLVEKSMTVSTHFVMFSCPQHSNNTWAKRNTIICLLLCLLYLVSCKNLGSLFAALLGSFCVVHLQWCHCGVFRVKNTSSIQKHLNVLLSCVFASY